MNEPESILSLDKEAIMESATKMTTAIVYNATLDELKRQQFEKREETLLVASAELSRLFVGMAEDADKIRGLQADLAAEVEHHQKVMCRLRRQQRLAEKQLNEAPAEIWIKQGKAQSVQAKRMEALYERCLAKGNFKEMPATYFREGPFQISRDTNTPTETVNCRRTLELAEQALRDQEKQHLERINPLHESITKLNAVREMKKKEYVPRKERQKEAIDTLFEGLNEMPPAHAVDATVLRKVAELVRSKADTFIACKDDLSEFRLKLISVETHAHEPEEEIDFLADAVAQLGHMLSDDGTRSALLEMLGAPRLMQLVTPPVDPEKPLASDVDEGGVLDAIQDAPVTSKPHVAGLEADKASFLAMTTNVDVGYLSTFQAYLDSQEVLPPSEVLASLADVIGSLAATALKYEMKIMFKCWDDKKVMETNGLQKEFKDKGIIIHWYTMQKPAVYAEVSIVLNDCVERVKPENPKVKAVLPFLKVLTSALDDLMAVPERFKFYGVAYRGIPYKFSDEQWLKFKEGNQVAWYTVKSVATHVNVMQEFLGPSTRDQDDWSPSECTIFTVQDCVATKVSEFSCYRAEEEALLKPGTLLKVLSAQRCSNATSRNVWERADQITLQMIV